MSTKSHHQGILAEVKATAYLLEQGYEVFVPVGGKTAFDLVAYKDGSLSRVQVKSTSVQAPSGNWTVLLQSVRANKTANVIHHFDNTKCDLLAVWIAPEDRVVLLETKNITTKAATTIPGRFRPVGVTPP